ncbi:uncharacterized protein [Nicotiana sylvestris]|uniref:uncharacterized protein n=1 Tax=Nicotiana sylvestris TaxID=4096 RepID=UPI00388CA5AD
MYFPDEEHPDTNFIDPIPVKIYDQPAYCVHVEEEADGKPWFHDIKEYLTTGEYPDLANATQKRTLWSLSKNFFHSGGILYRRTPDLGLLRCYVRKCHRCQIQADMIKVPPNDLTTTRSPWPFVAWGMDVIGPIEPAASNGHRFILVAIDYFTKWVEAASYKAVTKKVVADFVRDRIICRFGIPESIITDNSSNLNSDLMKAMCETFKIKHKNSTAYRPQMNGAVEASNKNIKKILRKIIERHNQWHEKLSFALLGYRTTVRTSTGATPYMLVYGTKAVIPVEVEIPSLRIMQEAELDDAEWVKGRYEQLALIDGKRMNALRKTLAQISLLSLLIHSDEHRRALMKILNEAHVPDKISVNHLEKIANKIFEVNIVTFSDDELPVEGTKHNRALYLTVKYEDSVVTRVLVDNGSSANICPLSILKKLKVDDDRIHKNNICVRGFDGGGNDPVGDIILELTIGPVEFTMEFQVLDVAVSYNLLLGRPWIHAAKAVPSTLHQMVFDTVSVEKVPEGKSVPVPRITAATVMVASKMLKNGFVPGKGLGADLQGIVQPIYLPKNLDTFGLGFRPTTADVRRARKMKKRVWALPKPIPHLSRSFVRPSIGKQLLAKVSGPLIGAHRNLEKGLERVFAEKLRKFKTDINVKIKKEITKQFDVKVIWVTRYPTWLANVVPVPKKDGKTKEIEVYVNDVIVKSRQQSDHIRDLRKFFQRLHRYNLKLNPAKCAFGVPSGKLLGFIVSHRGIELDPSKVKAIQELPPPRNKTEVMSLLGRLNYISKFIGQLTTTCEPIFKLLKKDVAVKWTDEC